MTRLFTFGGPWLTLAIVFVGFLSPTSIATPLMVYALARAVVITFVRPREKGAP